MFRLLRVTIISLITVFVILEGLLNYGAYLNSNRYEIAYGWTGNKAISKAVKRVQARCEDPRFLAYVMNGYSAIVQFECRSEDE